MEMLSNLGLQDIKIRLIPATMAYDLYLSGSKMDMGKFIIIQLGDNLVEDNT